FKGISWSYAEAAILDGANPYVIFFRIMLPQAKGIVLTYAITNSIAFWNEYQSIVLYLPSYPTLASGLFEFKARATRRANYPVYFAGLIISMIPTLVLFSAFSGRIMTSISVGGLKG
ncbi:MAG: carbohydrate ABC transporter permease, partial [Clostridia bacterium]|nr:carbohydrate ABC transporter permease [Clostridia bacterium]